MSNGLGYIEVTPETDDLWQFVNGVPGINEDEVLDPSDLHVTLMYDRRNAMPFTQTKDDRQRIFKAIPVQATLLGPDESPAVVITLASLDLHERHQELLDVGFEHSFDDYLPHVSVAYDPEDPHGMVMNINKVLSEIQGKMFGFTRERWSPTKTDED